MIDFREPLILFSFPIFHLLYAVGLYQFFFFAGAATLLIGKVREFGLVREGHCT